MGSLRLFPSLRRRRMAKLTVLDFEKSIAELDDNLAKLHQVVADRANPQNTPDLADQIAELEQHRRTLLEALFGHLTPWDQVLLARHPKRPYLLDYAAALFDPWQELHGDRLGYDDGAMVCGLARFDGQPANRKTASPHPPNSLSRPVESRAHATPAPRLPSLFFPRRPLMLRLALRLRNNHLFRRHRPHPLPRQLPHFLPRVELLLLLRRHLAISACATRDASWSNVKISYNVGSDIIRVTSAACIACPARSAITCPSSGFPKSAKSPIRSSALCRQHSSAKAQSAWIQHGTSGRNTLHYRATRRESDPMSRIAAQLVLEAERPRRRNLLGIALRRHLHLQRLLPHHRMIELHIASQPETIVRQES